MRALAMVAAASAALAASMPQLAPPSGEAPQEFFPGKHRGKGRNNRRGKGLVARAKKRPNRLHISKRVRRAHRREGK